MLKNIIIFLTTIFLTFVLLPSINVLSRPNLILVFLITLYLDIGFEKSIWFWVIGGIIMDSINGISFPINSAIFIIFFVLSIILKNIFDYKANMSKIITGLIFIGIYYSVLIVREMIDYNAFFLNQEYVKQGGITLLLFFIIWVFNRKKDEKTI